MIERSREIWREALANYDPYAVVMMNSGGKDSRATYEVAKMLGVKIDFVLHGVTGTGIEETRKYVHETVEGFGDRLIEANAGDAYEKYVMRKGFFGRGEKAHQFSYHILKSEHFRKCISKHIRQRKRGRKILLLNGARQQESNRRSKIHTQYIREQKNDVWVNLIHFMNTEERNEIISDVPVNPVYQQLCWSGECMCGTMQSQEDRIEASYHFPKWGRWLDSLEKEVMKKFPWKWGRNIPKSWHLEKLGQIPLFPNHDFQPMCQGCKVDYNKSA